jgi:hypothetical protein
MISDIRRAHRSKPTVLHVPRVYLEPVRSPFGNDVGMMPMNDRLGSPVEAGDCIYLIILLTCFVDTQLTGKAVYQSR